MLQVINLDVNDVVVVVVVHQGLTARRTSGRTSIGVWIMGEMMVLWGIRRRWKSLEVK